MSFHPVITPIFSNVTLQFQNRIPLTVTTPEQKRTIVARWLLLGVAMLIIQILLGGVTRLTGSGLSITEWKPLMGALPPMSENAWQIAFEKYKGIAQYKYMNAHFTLSDFKSIYFWEWMHREWARLVGVVFLIGFLYFLAKKYFDQRMVMPFAVLFILGGLQGALGWIMVQSGLNDTNLYVNHIRLSIHFIAALILLCYTLWFALILLVPAEKRVVNKRFFVFTLLTIGFLFIQLFYGAFMAGLKAAPVAATWPTLNGQWIPDQVNTYGNQTFTSIAQYVSHPVAVQFIHRTLAYILCGLLLAWFLVAGKVAKRQPGSLLARTRHWPLLLVLIQALLGILTVLNASNTISGHFGLFEWLAEAHQLIAMFLLITLVINLYSIKIADRP